MKLPEGGKAGKRLEDRTGDNDYRTQYLRNRNERLKKKSRLRKKITLRRRQGKTPGLGDIWEELQFDGLKGRFTDD